MGYLVELFCDVENMPYDCYLFGLKLWLRIAFLAQLGFAAFLREGTPELCKACARLCMKSTVF